MKLTLLFFALLLILKSAENGTTFRLTKVQCDVYDKSMVRVNLCECRPIRRGISSFNFNVTYFKPANNIYGNIALFKKDGWYKPFIINYTINGCDYLRKRNHPFFNFFYDRFKGFTNINHTCPFPGDIIVRDFGVNVDMLSKFSIPNGEYAFHMTWTLHGIKAYTTKLFMEYINFANNVIM